MSKLKSFNYSLIILDADEKIASLVLNEPCGDAEIAHWDHELNREFKPCERKIWCIGYGQKCIAHEEKLELERCNASCLCSFASHRFEEWYNPDVFNEYALWESNLADLEEFCSEYKHIWQADYIIWKNIHE